MSGMKHLKCRCGRLLGRPGLCDECKKEYTFQYSTSRKTDLRRDFVRGNGRWNKAHLRVPKRRRQTKRGFWYCSVCGKEKRRHEFGIYNPGRGYMFADENPGSYPAPWCKKCAETRPEEVLARYPNADIPRPDKYHRSEIHVQSHR